MSKMMVDVSNIRTLLERLNQGEPIDGVISDFDEKVADMAPIDILMAMIQVNYTEKKISIYDIREFFDIYDHLYERSIRDIHISDDMNHPLQILKRENKFFSESLDIIQYLIEDVENGDAAIVDTLVAEVERMGEIGRHFNRKEKLYFPLLERYGIHTLPRKMWSEHDHIRLLVRALKNRTAKIGDIEFRHIKNAFDDLRIACSEMMMAEAYLLVPLTGSLFKETDWAAIADESRAFGYVVETSGKYKPRMDERHVEPLDDTKHLAFGGGYLTTKEANLIMNHLPIEITFVDRNGLFKYFNTVVESAEMMFIRTPLSIGRNVANCHPPKSLKKVMHIIHDLKNRKKESETMWFRTKNKYVHVTYKAVFDENADFMGILEYVQDIQPFFELPREVKRNASPKK